ncbi:MAG: hypothetical protein K0Q67_1873, partial [Cellvibrio sp.]|nr:hypothetical protein [Cellvibrio sp.]
MNINRFSLLAVVLTLTACGGGSGSGSKSSSSSVASSMLSSSAASMASLSSAVSSVPSSAALSSESSSLAMSSVSSSAISASMSSASSSSAPIIVELAENGGFEESEAGSTAPANWFLATNEGGAVIQVINATDQPANVHTGDRALELAINTIGANPWSIEATHTGLDNNGIPVVGGSIYAYSAWVKGPAGAQANFTVGTPAPAYAERARRTVTLSGDWQEVAIEVTTSPDDTLLRLPVHFSLAANAGATIYVDDFSFTKLESITYEYS